MIQKWHRIKCDHCYVSEQFLGNVEDTMTEAKKYGWVVKRRNTEAPRHYCSDLCLTEAIYERILDTLNDPQEASIPQL